MDNVLAILLFFVFFIGAYFLGAEVNRNNFKQIGAMEVYRGNTKLQYTIIDSVKVDSCVIFLNK